MTRSYVFYFDFYHFIRERVLHKKFIFSAGNEFSAVQDNLPMLNLEHFQFLLFDIQMLNK
jgi:hypothetical protein